MADVNSVWTRTETGRLTRNTHKECIICSENTNIYYSCDNNHITCLNCMEKHFLSECGKMNSNVEKYITRQTDTIEKFKLVCCPFLRACSCNKEQIFNPLSIIRENFISFNTAEYIFKTKQYVDRAIGHSIANKTSQFV